MNFRKMFQMSFLSAAFLGASHSASALSLFGMDIGTEVDSGSVMDNIPILQIVWMPFAMLDQPAPQANVINASDLKDNGYSDAEIKTILEDQNKLNETLTASKQRIVLDQNETRETLTQGLRSIVPTLSDDYVNFVNDFSAIR